MPRIVISDCIFARYNYKKANLIFNEQEFCNTLSKARRRNFYPTCEMFCSQMSAFLQRRYLHVDTLFMTVYSLLRPFREAKLCGLM